MGSAGRCFGAFFSRVFGGLGEGFRGLASSWAHVQREIAGDEAGPLQSGL